MYSHVQYLKPILIFIFQYELAAWPIFNNARYIRDSAMRRVERGRLRGVLASDTGFGLVYSRVSGSIPGGSFGPGIPITLSVFPQ